MTNFIYNMQDELFNLNMILPVGEFSPIKKLVDHIEAQGKQLRELNAAITKRNKTIEKYECEKKELNEGIRNSEDLTWKQKYDALLQSSEQAIGAPQKKCSEIKNHRDMYETSFDNAKNNDMSSLKENINKLKVKFDKSNSWCSHESGISNILYIIEKLNKTEKALENEKKIGKNLNTIINNKNKLLDEYMTKCNNLEHNYKEEFKMTCFKHEETIRKLKHDNDILRGKAKEASNLAETILMLYDEE